MADNPNAPNFRMSRKFMGPSWLTDGDGGIAGFVMDTLKDAVAEHAREALLIRFPQTDPTGTPAPDDALAASGRDRRIVRGINEPSAAYSARLLRWLDDWATAGNPFALMKQLAGYMGVAPGNIAPAFRTVDVNGNWFSLNSDGSKVASIAQANWDWDGAPDALVRWSRFWVIIYPNGVWTTAPNYGSGQAYATTAFTWGSTATPDQVATVRGIVSDWKPAGTTCQNIILAFDGGSFSPATARDGVGLPNGTWGHWSKRTGQTRVAARLATARYWDGV